MGTRGPVPARSDQKRRRNKPETPVDRVSVDGKVAIPPAAENWHPTATAWYVSLSQSGQSRFYEPSDWQNAHFCAGLMTSVLTDDRANAQLVAQVRGLMADLLTTEGARRRAGIELERVGTPAAASTSGGNVTVMDDRRRRVADAS